HCPPASPAHSSRTSRCPAAHWSRQSDAGGHRVQRAGSDGDRIAERGTAGAWSVLPQGQNGQEIDRDCRAIEGVRRTAVAGLAERAAKDVPRLLEIVRHEVQVEIVAVALPQLWQDFPKPV